MSTTVAAVERKAVATERLSAFLELTKPRITVMVLVSMAASAWVASDGMLDVAVLLHALFGTALVAASSGAVNQWMERHRDALMDRTAERPLPSGRLTSFEVLAFAALTLIAGSMYLVWQVNLAAAAFAMATWLVYVAAYTPLKTRTVWNTAVGAVAGAGPMLIGAAAAGAPLSIPGWLLFAVLLVWQFPHFMAIAWLCRRQYQRAGYQMMTVSEPTGKRAGRHAVAGAAVLALLAFWPAALAPHSPLAWTLAVLAALLGAGQLRYAWAFWRRPDDASARRLLRASLVYLPAVLLLFALVPLS